MIESDSGWIGAGEEDDLDRRLAAEEEPFDSTRPHIMTALGAISPEAMGVALVQEQVVAGSGAGAAGPPEDLGAIVAALHDLFAAGGARSSTRPRSKRSGTSSGFVGSR